MQQGRPNRAPTSKYARMNEITLRISLFTTIVADFQLDLRHDNHGLTRGRDLKRNNEGERQCFNAFPQPDLLIPQLTPTSISVHYLGLVISNLPRAVIKQQPN